MKPFSGALPLRFRGFGFVVGFPILFLLLHLPGGGSRVAFAVEGDDTWAEGFEANGTDNDVMALASSGGVLYVGGVFRSAGTVIHAGRVAAWNGADWEALGLGVNGAVHAMVVQDGALIVGGSFTMAGGPGGVAALNIARWRDGAWEALGGGLAGGVRALTVFEGRVVAAGYGDGVAVWDEISGSWSRLGPAGGWDGPVLALSPFRRAIGDMVLVAGGDFTLAGGVAASCLAFWDGASWAQFASGVAGGSVRALALHSSGTALAVGGEFTSAGGIADARRVAIFSGTTWRRLGDGVGGAVHALVYYTAGGGGENLYVAGSFTTLGSGRSAVRIARWNGIAWDVLGEGLGDDGLALVVLGDDLVAGGSFETAGGLGAHHVALFDGSIWDNLDGDGMGDDVLALAGYDTLLVAGGRFHAAGGVAASCVAAWDGTQWAGLGGGVFAVGNPAPQVDPLVCALVQFGDSLIVGGQFDTAGTVAAANVAAWDGTQWHPLGDGLVGNTGGVAPVAALVVHNGKLYAGGGFQYSGSTPVRYLAEWTGSGWYPAAVELNGAVRTLLSWNDRLVAGGDFTEIRPGTPAQYFLACDEKDCRSLGAPFDGAVHALAEHDGALFVGGAFTSPVNYLAVYDGAWSGLSSDPDDVVEALAVYNDSLLVGGRFDNVGALAVNHVARWNGSHWVRLGSGVNLPVYALGSFQGELYVGGEFTLAGGKASCRIAERLEGTPVGVPETHTSTPLLPILHPPSPNPASRSVSVEFRLGQEGRTRLAVYDVRGRNVRTLLERSLRAGVHEVTWDGRDAAGRIVGHGVYFLLLEAPGGVRSERLTLVGGGR